MRVVKLLKRSKSIRVGYDTFAFRMQDYGGITNVFESLFLHFKKVDIVFLEPIPPVWVHRLNFLGVRHSRKIQYLQKRVFSKFNNLGQKQLINLVHLTYYDTTQAHKYKSLPLVSFAYDFIPERFPNEFPKGNPHLEKNKVLLDSALVLAISKSTAADIKRFVPNFLGEVVVVPLASKFPLKSNVEGVSFQSNGPFILYVGRRDAYKNVLNLISAWREIVGLNLVLFGGGELSESERELIPSDRRSDVFCLSGDDHLLQHLYQNAQALVVPSQWEGFGLPILEAFSLNCPVLCSRIEVFEELFGSAPVYFNQNSVLNIQQTIAAVIENPKRLKEMRVAGAKISEKYSWEKSAQVVEDAYLRLLTK